MFLCTPVFFVPRVEERPVRYLVPIGYEGTLITVFNRPGYPTLPVKEGFAIHEYPENGIIITSSSPVAGLGTGETIDSSLDGTKRILSTNEISGRRVLCYSSDRWVEEEGSEFIFHVQVIGDKLNDPNEGYEKIFDKTEEVMNLLGLEVNANWK